MTQLEELKNLIDLLNRGVSKQEFLDSFKKVLETVVGIEKNLLGKIGTAFSTQNQEIKDAFALLEPYKREFQKAIDAANSANDTTFESVRRRAIESIDGLFNRMRLNEKLQAALDDFAEKGRILEGKIALVPEIDTQKIAEDAAKLVPRLDAEDIANELEKLKGNARLSLDAIRGLDEWLEKTVGPSKSAGRTGWGAHPLTIMDEGTTVGKVVRYINFVGNGVSTSLLKSGVVVVTIAGASGASVATEKLTPSASGSDITLDLTGLSHTFSAILWVAKNGQILDPADASFGWSRSTNTITVLNGFPTDVYLVAYTY